MKYVWVRLIESGEVQKVRSDEFDEELHEKLTAAEARAALEDELGDDGDDGDEDGEGDSRSIPGMDAAAAMFKRTLEKRDAALLGGFEKMIADLAGAEDREIADLVSGGPRRATTNDGSRAQRRKQARGTIVSRNQPTDPLYARLYRQNPEYKDWRTPDLDYWNAQWIRGLVARDRNRMRVAEDKLDAITGYKRATTLEGVLDASDPTAILSGTGGHLLPQPLSAVVEIARDNVAVLPALVQNFTMTSATLRVPTAGAVTAAKVDEGSTASQGEPAFASDMLRATKAQAYMKASDEQLADSAFNLVGVYASRAGKALGELEDVDICTSDGVAPNLSEAIAGGNVDEATTTVLVYEDLVSLFFALKKIYRTNAVWLGNDATLTLLSTLMDGNDRPVLSLPTEQVNVVGDTAGAVGSIFRKPVYEVPLADGQLIFGDPMGYGFGRRAGIIAKVSDQVDFDSDLVNFKFTERYDGRIIDAVALKQMSALATVA